MASDRPDVALRRIPYPYRAMLAICSDLDETPDARVYFDIMRFLNTTQTTSMGPGVGLEVGNTLYFDMPPGCFSYWNADDAARDVLRTLIRSGHVDALHSYGDLAVSRRHAGRALDELARHDARLHVWIDHGVAPSNFGPDIMRGRGDVPGSDVYHADLTWEFGVRYVWRGRITSVVGQEAPFSIGGLWTLRHPIASTRTVAKETAKHVLGARTHEKYVMHGPNRVLRRSTLRDGRPVQEFLRNNPHWGGVSSCETGRGIGQVLTRSMLDRLADREAVCILYTHLGKVDRPERPFNESGVAAFRRLADAYYGGRILVLTTRRLLRYLTLRDCLTWTARRDGPAIIIDVTLSKNEFVGEVSPSVDLAGLTFYVPDDSRCRINVNGASVDKLWANPPDPTGRRSVMIPLKRFAFPDLPFAA